MKHSLWPVIFFMLGASLIGLQTLRRVRITNTTHEEKTETAKWAVAFLVIGPMAVASFFLTLYQNRLWPFG